MNTRLTLSLLLSASLPLLAEEPDWKLVTPDAGFQQRDSSGEVVLNGKMWILGGWFDSYKSAPRDVWSSEDGVTWTKVLDEAPWKHSDLPMSLAFKDRMWMLGGWYNGRLPGHESGNQVWSSPDGKNWEAATTNAAWTPRIAAGAVVFNDRMWILGGLENYYFGTADNLKNDVWSSADGKEWQQETEHAPWSPRAYHGAVVHDGKIWVLGGGNYVPNYHAKNDVWSSTDGQHWELATDKAPWDPRLWFSAVTYRDHIWVLGGWANNPSHNLGDVWYSRDGKDWKQLKTPTIWTPRHEHSAYVFQDKIWLATGHAYPLSKEVWSLQLPPDWGSRTVAP